MKKIFLFLTISVLLTGSDCSTNTLNNTTSQNYSTLSPAASSTQEFFLISDFDRLDISEFHSQYENLKKTKKLWGVGELKVFPSYNRRFLGRSLAEQVFSYQDKTFDLLSGYDLKGEQFQTLFQNNNILIAGIRFCGATESILDFKEVNNFPAVTFISSCRTTTTSVESARNIYYRDEFFNKKYNLDESHFLFSYQNKIGFVAVKDGKEYIHFNDKKISSDYDHIITHSCCSLASHFTVTENGIASFLAVKDRKYRLIEIDLNKHLQ